MTSGDFMTSEEWNMMCNEVTSQMLEHIKPYTTPISKVLADDYGEHCGSGSFLCHANSRYLITNEHVAKALESHSLAHQFNESESESVVRITKPMCAKQYPFDLALSKIPDKAWSVCRHKSNAIHLARFAHKHDPVDGELLFMIGYSDERSDFYFGYLNSPGTPYTTQETSFPKDIGDPKYHFAIHYKPDLAISVDGKFRGLPKPPGMSGSLVWNTRFVEYFQQNKEWSPNQAQVTGIVWGWPSSDACLLATRVEHFDIEKFVEVANSLA